MKVIHPGSATICPNYSNPVIHLDGAYTDRGISIEFINPAEFDTNTKLGRGQARLVISAEVLNSAWAQCTPEGADEDPSWPRHSYPKHSKPTKWPCSYLVAANEVALTQFEDGTHGDYGISFVASLWWTPNATIDFELKIEYLANVPGYQKLNLLRTTLRRNLAFTQHA